MPLPADLTDLLDQLIVTNRRAGWVDPATKRRARGVLEQILAQPDRPPAEPEAASKPRVPAKPAVRTSPEREDTLARLLNRQPPQLSREAGLTAGPVIRRYPSRKARRRQRARRSPANPNSFYLCRCDSSV